ncbi:MAG: phage prohead protein [Candidatus Azobacteroides sp.]|nr:phage prohead protein [Candidatus Azobacteroides sp.]
MEELKIKTYRTKTSDVDEIKGIVSVAVNGIGIKDADGDISDKGSFNKTLKENFSRVKWFLNHDKTKLLGCPIEGKEENNNLVMTGRLNLKKEIGRDILEDYKLYAEYGKTLEHSIGVKAVKRDESDKSIVKEWSLWEYSTLTNWGANPNTYLIDIKEEKDINYHVKMIEKALGMRYSDERLKSLEYNLEIIKKAVMGNNMVKCGHCGLIFDYDSVPEETLESQIIDTVGDYVRWETEGIVSQEIRKLRPEIQERVLNIIESKKSIDDLSSYVHCPKCYTRIYRSSIISVEPPEGTQQKQSRHTGTLGLKDISKYLTD